MAEQRIPRLTFKFRLYPTRSQVSSFEATLDVCRELYNASLQERRDAYRLERKSVRYVEQANQLPEIKKIRTDVAGIHSQVLQDVLKRVEKAFDGFFRRVKTKQKAGFPRFRSHKRYDSFTYAQSGFSVNDGKLRLSKIGSLRIKLHRPIEGKVKTLTVTRSATGKWYACFSVEIEPQPLPANDRAIGIDVGLAHFATLATATIERIGTRQVRVAFQENRWHDRERYCTLSKATPETSPSGGHGQGVICDDIQIRTHGISGSGSDHQRQRRFLPALPYRENIRASWLVPANSIRQAEISPSCAVFGDGQQPYLGSRHSTYYGTRGLRRHSLPDTLLDRRGTVRGWSHNDDASVRGVCPYSSQRKSAYRRDEFLCLCTACVNYKIRDEDCQTQSYSNGEQIANPRFFRTDEKALGRAQRHERRKAASRIHERIANRRRNFAHQLSHALVSMFSVIAFEDLNIKGMIRNHCLSKSIQDAAWNQLVQFTTYKAENAGRTCVQVDPRNTSKLCSACGTLVEKDLSVRVHRCSCGLSLDRDVNAAINILARGLADVSLRAKEAPSF